MQAPPKAIAENLSRYQSQALVWVVGTILTVCCLLPHLLMTRHQGSVLPLVKVEVVSLTFGMLVWVLRAATPAAAFFGAVICDIVTVWTMRSMSQSSIYSALTPLIVLFLLTFVATRIGKRRKPELTSVREARRGRTASQVIANLGIAPLVLAFGVFDGFARFPRHGASLWEAGMTVMMLPVLAALAEATADTVSSELGQAFGGTPYLLTTFRPAPAGTDGAVSLLGTLAGVAGAALVTAAGVWAMHLDLRRGLLVFVGGVAGLIFDSLLGATVERRGWLNNDLVNFSSTAFAALFTLMLLAI